MLLTFWGCFGRIFDLRASKRIIGGIDTGQLTATCFAFFVISFISDYIVTEDILWISTISSAGFFLLTTYVCSRYKLEQTDAHSSSLAHASHARMHEKKRPSIGYVDLLKNKYFLLLSLFLIVSVCLSKLNEYSYRTTMSINAEGERKGVECDLCAIGCVYYCRQFFDTDVSQRHYYRSFWFKDIDDGHAGGIGFVYDWRDCGGAHFCV